MIIFLQVDNVLFDGLNWPWEVHQNLNSSNYCLFLKLHLADHIVLSIYCDKNLRNRKWHINVSLVSISLLEHLDNGRTEGVIFCIVIVGEQLVTRFHHHRCVAHVQKREKRKCEHNSGNSRKINFNTNKRYASIII